MSLESERIEFFEEKKSLIGQGIWREYPQESDSPVLEEVSYDEYNNITHLKRYKMFRLKEMYMDILLFIN